MINTICKAQKTENKDYNSCQNTDQELVYARNAKEAHAQGFIEYYEMLRVLSIISSMAQCTRSLHVTRNVFSL
jgi:hypothetical protein